MTEKPKDSASLYQPLSRAFEIVELLGREPHGLPLSGICEQMGLAKSAAFRLLNTLANDGYVDQDPLSERYRLTLRLPALGFRYAGVTGLTDAAQPVLDALAAKTQELVQFGILSQDKLIWVAWSQGSVSPLQYTPGAGREVTLHTTASGAAWLAEMDENEALAIVAETGLRNLPTRGYGLRAVKTLEEFRDKLARTRAQGYGINDQEGERGINAIAVVVRSDATPDAPVVGTLAIAGPAARVTREELESFLPDLRHAAEDLSRVWPMRKRLMAMQPRALATPSTGGEDGE